MGATLFVFIEGREGRRQIEARLDKMDVRLDANLQAAADRMKGIGEDLQAVRHSAMQMLDVGKSISGLQDILRAPKLRGGLGELLLERLLEDILPLANYEFQRRFKNGEIVDAVIDLGVATVPVDAKFPLESFSRMASAETGDQQSKLRREFLRVVRGHVDSVAKYIRPDEGTFDFALMYIPAENIYYETIVKGELEMDGASLAEYALGKRVVPVSPNSFYAYLQAIALGLRGMHVEREALEILGRLGRLNGDFLRLKDDFRVLGTHLTHAKGKYDEVSQSMERLGDRLALTAAEGARELQPETAPGRPVERAREFGPQSD